MMLLMQPRTQLAFWDANAHCLVISSLASHPPGSPSPSRRAALNLSIPQPVLILEVALTQVPCLVFSLVNPHDIPTGPLLELVQIPLDDIPSFRCGNSTTQLGVILKFAEGVLDILFYAIDEDIK
ncbi:hypothetical protein TURU_095604 [Turdus rufiventris]|nr:hypothetical protein TURU_095604 [Turdus rufiventris]